MYGYMAASLRRCRGVRRDGSPCRAWAKWNATEQRCAAHSSHPRRTRAGSGNSWPFMPPPAKPARYTPCRCIAYAWPHRPASGLCRWPLEPEYRLTTRAGTHRWPRDRGMFRALGRQMLAYQKAQRRGRLSRPSEVSTFSALSRLVSRLGYGQSR